MAAFTSAWQAKPQAVHRNTASALTRVPVHLPARRAPLARERGTDLFNLARGLVLQSPSPAAPTPTPGSPGSARPWPGRSGPGSPACPSRTVVMLPIRRTSTRIRSNRRARSVETFSAQSLRRSVSRARSRAIACLTRPRRFEPRFAPASVRCSRRSLVRSRPVRPRPCSISPVDRAAETATRSMPTASPMPGAGTGAGITAKATCRLPAQYRHPIEFLLPAPRGTSGTGPSRPWAPRLGRHGRTPAARPCRPRRPVIRIPHPARPCATTAARPGCPGRRNAVIARATSLSACCCTV